MANRLDERIAAIAVRCCDDGERMTFNELADELGQSRRFMGQRVGHAAQAMDDEGRSVTSTTPSITRSRTRMGIRDRTGRIEPAGKPAPFRKSQSGTALFSFSLTKCIYISHFVWGRIVERKCGRGYFFILKIFQPKPT